jgi:zinc-binding alcohol dehydrogenase family protein
MKAIGYSACLPATDPNALVDFETDRPKPGPRDLLVEVKAVSVNPVDTKVRRNAAPKPGERRILGWDASGVVVEVGSAVTLFRPGDEVFYAGSIVRPGANSEFHAVDERIVGRKPATLDFAQAAALPLTSITGWEALFDRIRVKDAVPGAANAILIIGGAGGVGSIAIQLARTLTGLTVIATASRPETQDWVRGLGAHHVIDHRKPLAPQVEALGLGMPGLVFCTTETAAHSADIVALLAPQGRLAMIDDPGTFDIMPFKRKCLSVHWEAMFARSMFETADMIGQHELLNEVSRRVDEGVLRTTLGESFGTINAENLRRAHALIETGTARGKIVLAGF